MANANQDNLDPRLVQDMQRVYDKQIKGVDQDVHVVVKACKIENCVHVFSVVKKNENVFVRYREYYNEDELVREIMWPARRWLVIE